MDPNGGEFTGDESHGIESVKNHLKNKQKYITFCLSTFTLLA